MATQQQIATAVASLDAMTGSDPERAHAIADEILEQFVPAPVLLARERLIERCPWWGAA